MHWSKLLRDFLHGDVVEIEVTKDNNAEESTMLDVEVTDKEDPEGDTIDAEFVKGMKHLMIFSEPEIIKLDIEELKILVTSVMNDINTYVTFKEGLPINVFRIFLSQML